MNATQPGTVLLDRDGVIVRDRPGYIRDPAQLELLPGAAAAIRRLCQAGCRVMVVTNQSVVGRGLISGATLDAIHDRLRALVASEFGGIDRVLVCPHHPAAGCVCRKPRPGLLFMARDQAGVALDDAVLVGDMPSDVDAARAAGCAAILVGGAHVDGVPSAPDLAAAVDLLLGAPVPC
jgi:D-glycero-D-manno-heptose 1,7-bisphosphate phosphatase